MAQRLKPLLDKVLVQKVMPMTKSAAGIFLPETAAARVNEGIVLATGPGKRTLDGSLIPVSVKEGDKVLLPEFGGITVKLEEDKTKETSYHLYRDDEILGILQDK
ncbi:small molecular heat shock protein 10 [Dunaliella salina]|uniref:Small molecular heat shock protein 10 n=1 Tax=Dunaliella salina TaxID=3046 RepID=A0ABQ7GY21_DUNSA|nr:small molecular heat shock protein 10 [Dunaliella salina]|eukprot:KAF5839504.1 small molecular heat shock protein 10 [Dunaliella salina]